MDKQSAKSLRFACFPNHSAPRPSAHPMRILADFSPSTILASDAFLRSEYPSSPAATGVAAVFRPAWTSRTFGGVGPSKSRRVAKSIIWTLFITGFFKTGWFSSKISVHVLKRSRFARTIFRIPSCRLSKSTPFTALDTLSPKPQNPFYMIKYLKLN